MEKVQSAGNVVRSKINVVETALKDAGTEQAFHAIVETLKAVARALDDVERLARRDQ